MKAAKRRFTPGIVFCLIPLLCVPGGCGAPPEGITITNAYVREPVAGRPVASGYFEIENSGPSARKLIGARTGAAERVEIHTHEHDGDMMRMRRVDAVDLTPGQTVAFAPGGLHLMLFGVSTMPDELEVVLVFDDGGEERVRFAVRRHEGGSTT